MKWIVCLLFAASFARAQQITIPLWPNGTPESHGASVADREFTGQSDRMVGGKKFTYVREVSKPMLTVYSVDGAKNSKAAILVFPGGAYQRLAYDLEGTEVCNWLNSIDVNCILVKYRVPFEHHFPEQIEDLEDAQQAIRITRSHADEWHIDPHRIGVLGFSAGAHLAVTLSNHSDFKRDNAPETPESKIDAKPNFALIIYPGYLTDAPDLSKLNPAIEVTANTPPSFLIQTEDDMAHVENVLLYFKALKDAGVKAELHVFAEGWPWIWPASHGISCKSLACIG